MDNPAANIIPAISPSPTPSPKNSFLPLIIITLVLFGAIGALAYQNWILQKQIINLESQIAVTPSIIPTSTPSPTVYHTPTPSASVKILKYLLPTNWQTVANNGQQFEVGYDPVTMKVDATSSISIRRPAPSVILDRFMDIKLISYSGGSRHDFIYKAMGIKPVAADYSPTYHEEEYLYNNHSCLFLIGIHLSQFPTTWGMCDAGGGQAFLISSYDDLNFLPIVQTLKTLK